ncbi:MULTISPECIES: O-antigen ligase family protein [Pseudomonas]|uniref:O-antigen ligase family protein n=1 Tax=Pseudomonas nitroreducens TaxID=46680 RepID=UPI00147BF1C0|nr:MULTISPECIES: O-antigen ligase family protein [Pseudomonas]NNN24157.1 O-antigen ligase family protein [Pseudomonas nitroreducens]
MQIQRIAQVLKVVGIVLAGMLLVSLLVGRFWWPTDSGNWEKSLRLMTGLAVLASALTLIRERARWMSMLVLLFGLFWLGLLANALAADSSSSVRQLLMILLFSLVVIGGGGADSRFWRVVLGTGAIAGAGFAAFSLLYKAQLGQFSLAYRTMNIHDSGVPGVADFGITIEAGMNYAFSFVVALWLAVRSRRWPAFSVWSLCTLLQGIYIYFTFSRAAWMAALIGAVALILVATQGRMRKVALGLLALGGAAAAIGGYRQLAYEFGSRGLTHRDEVWRTVIERVGENWWFGHGSHTELGDVVLSTGQVVHNPHSLYLEVLYQFGAVGLASLLVILLASLWTLWRSRASMAPLWFSVLAASTIVFMVEMHFFVAAPNVVWMWLWLPLAGALAAASDDKRALRQAPVSPALSVQPA